MSRFLMRILTAIQLTRLTIAFGAVSDIWFIILLTRAEPRYTHIQVHNLPIGLSLLAGAVLALGLFAHGAALNDLLDLQHDSAFSPDRPIPAGRIRIGQAVVITIGALLMAFLGASILGVWAVLLTLLMAAGLLFYNTAGKFIPAVGFTTIGLLYVVHMLIPNHELSFHASSLADHDPYHGYFDGRASSRREEAENYNPDDRDDFDCMGLLVSDHYWGRDYQSRLTLACWY